MALSKDLFFSIGRVDLKSRNLDIQSDFHISLPRRMKLSLQFRVTEMTSSKNPSFGWNLVYFGISLTFLIQTLGSPLLADYYRGTLNTTIVKIVWSSCFLLRKISLLTNRGWRWECRWSYLKNCQDYIQYTKRFFPESASVSPSQLIVDGVINTVMCDINLNFPTLQSSREQVQKMCFHYTFESYGFNQELMHNLV